MNKFNILSNMRSGSFVIIDAIVIVLAFYASFWIRLDSPELELYKKVINSYIPWILPIHLAIFYRVGLYRQVIKYANLSSVFLVLRGISLSILLCICIHFFIKNTLVVPRSIPIIYFLLLLISILGVRFSRRCYDLVTASFLQSRSQKPAALIFGAGGAGDLLVRHIKSNRDFHYKILGFVDDDQRKTGRFFHGLKVLGTRKILPEYCVPKKIEAIIIAMPSARGEALTELLELCVQHSIKSLFMPGIESILEGKGINLRTIQLGDLLKRSPRAVNQNQIANFFGDSSILVTGAGGSIGSEICRQIIQFGSPSKIILLDICEFNLYKINEELTAGLAQTTVIPVLGCATDDILVNRVFGLHKPQFVLHAAAYKHVPLVEANPTVGIYNNLMSTMCLATAAVAHGSQGFVLISSDKAVRPTNVMGATKRACEKLILTKHAQDSQCCFSAVRFGNVLGSSGSVVPKFLNQIENGGPITVTHPDITRYFMLTEEAVALVLQCASDSDGGEIFVLDMGEPIKIDDMAKKIASLVGKTVGKDIDIKYTGLRPGEKMHEELLLDGEEIPTENKGILVVRQFDFDPSEVESVIKTITRLAEAEDMACKKILFNFIENINKTMVPVSREENSKIRKDLPKRSIEVRELTN